MPLSPTCNVVNEWEESVLLGKKIMIIRVINQLRDDSFPGKIISQGQVATGGHFGDKAPGAEKIPVP